MKTPVSSHDEPSAPASRVQRVDSIEIVRLLGRGGTSEVFLGWAHGQGGVRRHVVLKRLLPRLLLDPRASNLLAHEADLLSRVHHHAIVRMLDFRLVDGTPTLILERVDGLSLATLASSLEARGQALSDAASLFLAQRLFGALTALHEAADPRSGDPAPIVHRDITPANLLVPWDGYAKIVDFGIAIIEGHARDAPAGVVKGTPLYMAPEQAVGGVVSRASDVYSACVVVRELMTRTLSAKRVSPRGPSLRRAIELTRTSTRSLRPDLPRALTDALDAGLEPDPEQRVVTAREILEILTKALADLARASLTRSLAGLRESGHSS